ncbi:MAG: PRC-barrel domain-containing protein [Solirubrobacteraceae bacterium]
MRVAGTVGRAHGLDGSFYVNAAQAELLDVGCAVTIDGCSSAIVRRAGTDARPIVRVEGCTNRAAAEALRGTQLLAEAALPLPLGPDEYRAEELEGARLFDGDRELGVVRELIGLPSCECLAVTRSDGGPELLVPLVRDAIRAVDVAARRIEIDMRFLGEDIEAS